MWPEADGGGDGTGGQASAGGDGRRRLTRALARGAGVGLGVLIATTRLPRRATALAVGGLLGGATAAVVGAVTAAEGWHETREQETEVPRSPSRSGAPDLAPTPRP